jgi:transcriptional regulator with PAS, ATPase and Fis domain
LENVLGRAMISMSFHDRIIQNEHLPPLQLLRPSQSPPAPPLSYQEAETLQDVMARVEREHIRRALEGANGNKTEAARRLGISVRNLYYKMEKHGIHL